MKKDYYLVAFQMLLFAMYLWEREAWKFQPSYILKLIGLIITITGILTIIIALLQLNKNLSPFPTPKPGIPLIRNGIYGIVRHPIYTGIFLTTFGFGIFTGSPYKILIAIILIIFFNYKASYEEKLLLKHFSSYKDYMQNTGKLFPKIKFPGSRSSQ